MVEQISVMSFYYAQDVYQKNQLGTRLYEKTDMIPGVNIISGKGSTASVNGAGGWGVGGVGVWGVLGSNEHLDWLKIDLNVA